MTPSKPAGPVLIAYDGSDFAKATIEQIAEHLQAGRKAIILTVSEPLGGTPFLGAAGVPLERETMDGLLDAATTAPRKSPRKARGSRAAPASIQRRSWWSGPRSGTGSSRPQTS